MGRIQGKVAVITRAASGISRCDGAPICEGRRERGPYRFECAARRDRGRRMRCGWRARGVSAHRRDVTSEADIKAAVARAVKEYGRLDIMFNNAGVAGAVGPIEKVESADWDRTIAVLLRAAFLGMKYSIPEMRKAGGGSIISTASVAGLRGVGYLAAYSAAKAAVVNLTQAVAIEVGHDKIRVNCICPGGVNTPLIHRGVPGGEERSEKSMARMQPIPRAGKPDDIATMALFLASDEADWISGTAMVVDGGINTGNARFRLAGLPDSGFSGPSFEM